MSKGSKRLEKLERKIREIERMQQVDPESQEPPDEDLWEAADNNLMPLGHLEDKAEELEKLKSERDQLLEKVETVKRQHEVSQHSKQRAYEEEKARRRKETAERRANLPPVGTLPWVEAADIAALRAFLHWNGGFITTKGVTKADVQRKVRDLIENTLPEKLITDAETANKRKEMLANVDTIKGEPVAIQDNGLPKGYTRPSVKVPVQELPSLPLPPDFDPLPEGMPDPRHKLTPELAAKHTDDELLLWAQARHIMRMSELQRRADEIKEMRRGIKTPVTLRLMDLDIKALERAASKSFKMSSGAQVRRLASLGEMGAEKRQAVQLRRGPHLPATKKRKQSVTEIMQDRVLEETENIIRPYVEGLKLRPQDHWSPMYALEFYRGQKELVESLLDRTEGKAVQRTRMVDKDGEDVMAQVQNVNPDVAVKVALGFFQNMQLEGGKPTLNGLPSMEVKALPASDDNLDDDDWPIDDISDGDDGVEVEEL